MTAIFEMLAIAPSGCGKIAAPTLVLHGADDNLLTVEHGQHTAETIPGAQFKVYDNMGHNLPDEIVPTMVEDMLKHFRANPIATPVTAVQ